MRYLLLLAISLVVGCSSAPYNDDHVQHVNSLAQQFSENRKITFSFSESQLVDLRGKYQSNDTVGQSAIMYQGGAGLVGLFAQIGTHAALVNSSRDGKLSEAQVQANEQIRPLLDLTGDMSLLTLLGKFSSGLVKQEDVSKDTLLLRPIFFSNSEMNQLSLKLVAWIPSGKKSRKKQYLYQNMVEVYGLALDETEQQDLLSGTDHILVSKLSSLLQTAIHVLSNDLKGVYADLDTVDQTYFIKQDANNKVVRGTLVDENCGYLVVQDLHSWLIAFPAEDVNEHEKPDLLKQC